MTAPDQALKAAVERVESLTRYLRREAQKNKDQRSKAIHGAHFVTRARKLNQAADLIDTLLAALSSQAEVMEALTEIAEIAAFEDADDNISRDDFSRGVRAARLDAGRIARQALKQETQS